MHPYFELYVGLGILLAAAISHCWSLNRNDSIILNQETSPKTYNSNITSGYICSNLRMSKADGLFFPKKDRLHSYFCVSKCVSVQYLKFHKTLHSLVPHIAKRLSLFFNQKLQTFHNSPFKYYLQFPS